MPSEPTRRVVFKQHEEEGDWTITVDGEEVANVASDDMDIASCAFEPLWERLGIEMEFRDAE